MKASDYIANALAENGVKVIFGITGAHIIHVIDSICRHADLKFIPMVHEQAASFAADAYARMTGNIGVCLSTSGPGAVNLLSGVCSAYFDSVPLLVITGQVVTSSMRGDLDIRQLGFQETDVVKIFQPVTKEALKVSPQDLKSKLRYAIDLAKAPRPGPVLLDLPDDVQRASI